MSNAHPFCVSVLLFLFLFSFLEFLEDALCTFLRRSSPTSPLTARPTLFDSMYLLDASFSQCSDRGTDPRYFGLCC